jgi:lysophospholipase L1-like esterase
VNKAKIVAVGDSLTYGYPYTPAYYWVRIAGEHLGLAIINKGICGETTEDMKRRFAIDVAALDPDYVIICGGSNDAFLGVAAPGVAGNVAAMSAAARSCGISPIIGLPPPVDYPEEELLAVYRGLLRTFAAAGSLPILDFYAALAAPDGGLLPGLHTDGVHPNEDGYALMAKAAIATLEIVIGKENR